MLGFSSQADRFANNVWALSHCHLTYSAELVSCKMNDFSPGYFIRTFDKSLLKSEQVICCDNLMEFWHGIKQEVTLLNLFGRWVDRPGHWKRERRRGKTRRRGEDLSAACVSFLVVDLSQKHWSSFWRDDGHVHLWFTTVMCYVYWLVCHINWGSAVSW